MSKKKTRKTANTKTSRLVFEVEHTTKIKVSDLEDSIRKWMFESDRSELPDNIISFQMVKRDTLKGTRCSSYFEEKKRGASKVSKRGKQSSGSRKSVQANNKKKRKVSKSGASKVSSDRKSPKRKAGTGGKGSNS